MSTAGLELSSFINPKLTWKTVSKGRSTSRRSRRLVLKNLKMGHEQNKSPKREESQVSECVKVNGVARRYGDSMEHIPIKKRRFLLRSPSPSPRSPHDESGELEKSSCISDLPTILVSNKIGDDSANVETSLLDADDSSCDGNKNKLKATDEVCGFGDDFSGIVILADACIDMLYKPSVNNMSAIDKTVIKEHINSPKEHMIDEALPPANCVTSQTIERTKTSTASRDDRLHWDLNAPMDEWDHPLDYTIVDSAMELETETVDRLEEANVCTLKISTLQPSVGGAYTCKALSDVTHFLSGTELAQKRDCHTGNSGLIAGEALSELTHNASDSSPVQVFGKVETFQQHNIGPSSCMNDRFIPSGISNDQVADRFETVDHFLQLGSNVTRKSVSGEKSMVADSAFQIVAKERSASAIEVDDNEKSEKGLLLKPVSMEADFDSDNATREVVKNISKIMKSDEIKLELPKLPFQPLQQYSMAPKKSELALPTLGASVDEATNEGLNKVNYDPLKLSKYCEIKTKVNNAMVQPLVSNQLDAKKCETESIETSDLEQTCKIQISYREDIVAPEKKNEVGCISCNLDDAPQTVESYRIDSENDIILKHVGISCYSTNSKDGASTSKDGKYLNSACGVETESETGTVGGYEVQRHMKMENTLVDMMELPCEDSSDRILKLQVSHDDCIQVVSSGLEGSYDSYIEDGEFREHHCVDNDDKERESEQAHSDFDNIEENKFTCSIDEPIAEKVVAVVCEEQCNKLLDHLQCDQLPSVEKNIEEEPSRSHQNSLLAGGDVGEDCLKANPPPSNSISMTQLSAMDNPEVVDMDLDDGRKSSVVFGDQKEDANDCFEDIGDVYIGGVGTKDSRRESQSQIEGPFSSYRRGAHITPRSRYGSFNQSYYRDERRIGVNESLGRGRSFHLDRGGRLGSRYWNRGLRNVAADPATEVNDEKFVGPSDEDSLGARQQGMFPGLRGGYTHVARRRSPAGRDESYDMGLVKVRDVNSENGQRNRYDRHFTGLSRGPREGYRGPVYETPNSSSSMSNHFIKRDQSFSPGGSRVDTHPPRGGGPARSRSRSRTQSPDIRADDRMGRMRAQYQNADYFRERRPPVRVFGQGQRFDTNVGRLRPENCVRPVSRPVRFLDGPPSGRLHEYENDNNEGKRKTYPPRSYRRSRSKSRSCSPEFRNEARMGRMRPPYGVTSHARDYMTDRRSPPKIFHAGKRFDTTGSPPNRPRSGDYMRPIGRPVRFQDNGQPSRENEYEGDDYRRKPRTIFDRIRPTRNYDMEGDGRRFEYDVEDGIATENNHRGDTYGRGGDRRAADVVRGSREETSSTRYNMERMYLGAPKALGIREYSDDALPRHLRPE